MSYRGLWRYVTATAVLVGALWVTAVSAETLGDVLRDRGVAVPPRERKGLDQPITSYAILDDKRMFLIAYYRLDGGGSLREPLFVRRFDRTSFQWRSVKLSARAVRAGKVDCLGSITGIHSSGREIYLDTHLTPSAGCTIVLAPDLSVRKVLYGWFLAAFADGSLVYHRSQVHVAPTHAAEISVYDIRRDRDSPIYPMKPYQSIRLEHITRVSSIYGDEAWCRARNHHCDPERFDSHLVGTVEVDDATSALWFVAAFDNTVFWSDAERARLEAFRELRTAWAGTTGSAPTDRLFMALHADLQRAARTLGQDRLLDTIEADQELRDLLAAALGRERPPGEDWRAFFEGLDSRWVEPDLWERLAKAVEVPPELTEAVYVYRNVNNGGQIEYRELSRSDFGARCGGGAPSICLEPEALARIFKR